MPPENDQDQTDETRKAQNGAGADDGGADDRTDDQDEKDWKSEAERQAKELMDAKKRLARIDQDRKRIDTARQELAEKLRRWDDIADDPEEVEEAVRKSRENQEQEHKSKGDFDKLIENRTRNYVRQIEERDTKLVEKDKMIERLTVGSRLRTAIAASGITDAVFQEAVFEMHKAKTKYVLDPAAEDGVSVVVEVDDMEMDVGDFLKQWVEGEAGSRFLPPRRDAGGGATGTQQRQTGKRWKPRSEMTPKEQSEAMAELGHDKYLALPYNRDEGGRTAH